MFIWYKKFCEFWEWVGVEDLYCFLGRIDDFVENNMEGKSMVIDLFSMVVNGFNFLNEIGGN